MFCPQCGQRQASNDVRFCSRCGFQLGGVAGLLTTNGATSANALQGVAGVDTPRRKGARLGGKLMLFGIFLGPVLAMLSEILRVPDEIALIGVIVFMAGLLRLIYAFLFEDGPFRKQNLPNFYAPPVAQNQFAQTSAPALPPSSGMPANSYVSPRTNTAEIAYRPSVTEGTTRLLENESESVKASDRDL